MKTYELTVICAGSTSDTDIPASWDRVQKVLTDAGATNVQAAPLGKFKLQYSIKDNTHGHVSTFTFNSEPAASQVIQNKLKLTADVIRYAVEVFAPARIKKTPQIAEIILLKTARRERERDEERGERRETQDRAADVARVAVPVFATSRTDTTMDVQQKEEVKQVNLEEIDKKLDELLAGDLTPTI